MNRDCDTSKYFKKPEDYRLIGGRNYVHNDAYLKVTGQAKYAGDLRFPGMLIGKIVVSPYSHARIISIDTSEAEKVPGVFGILTGADFGDQRVGNGEFNKEMADKEPLCKTEVRFVGDDVAAVCAIDEFTAQKAADLIKVEYEELPAVYNCDEAMADGAPQVQPFSHERNIGMSAVHRAGLDGKTQEGEFAKAAHIEKGEFHTHRIQHVPMETHACCAKYDSLTGEWTVWNSTSMTFADQYWLARVFGVHENKFHVIRPFVGGNFGGKADTQAMVFCACEFARRTGRAVSFVGTREEEFISNRGRHPMDAYLETAFDENGKILAKKSLHNLNGGAYGGSGIATCHSCSLWASFPYKVDAINNVSHRVYTNTTPNGAMRGYTACQVSFAHDMIMTSAAEAMGIDPIEFRKRSIVESGYCSPIGIKVTSCAMRETIDDALTHTGWNEKKDKLKPGEGIGFGITAFVSGSGFALLETPNQMSACCQIRINMRGIVTMYNNGHDVGQASDTTNAALIADELGLGMDDVKIADASTYNAPFDSGAYGSRVTFFSGNASIRAAVDAKRQIFECIGAKWGVLPYTLECMDHQVVCREENLSMPWEEAVYYTMKCNGGDEILGIGSYYHRTSNAQYHGKPSNYSPAYVFSTGACHLNVDMETGQLDIDDFFFGHDCGRPLNKDSVEGQLCGSIVSGLGYAIYENCRYNEKGKNLNPGLRDYHVPTALDIPPITLKYDYAPDPEGPYGAKECGEGTTAPIAPAVANAIHYATGIKINSLPLDPESVWRMMREQGKIPVYE